MRLFKKQEKVTPYQGPVIKHIDELKVSIKRVLLTDLNTRRDHDALGVFEVHRADGQIGALVLLSNESESALHEKADLLLALSRSKYLNTQLTVVYPTVIQSAYKLIGKHTEISHDLLVSRCQELFSKAAARQASDIHITAHKDQVLVEARIHGVMNFLDRFSFDDMHKMLSSLYNQHASSQSKDLTFNPDREQRTVIPMVLNGEPYQLRFESNSIEPDQGFVVVLRLLSQKPNSAIKPIKSCGYAPLQIDDIKRAKARDSGLIMIAGETGSGKSTTNASLISDVLKEHEGRISAFSVESPVEYIIEGVRQIAIHQGMNERSEETAQNFSRAVSGLLRMDPDILMIGEVSDQHTAKTLQHAVQSGHKVFSTIHAAGVLKIFNRLIGLGLERDVISEPNFISLFVYQKLVPVLCDHCALSYQSGESVEVDVGIMRSAMRYGMDAEVPKIRTLNSKGCSHCESGVKGRTLIAETLRPTPKLLNALKHSNYEEAYKIWRDQGGVRYQEHGLLKMLEGGVCPQTLMGRIGLLDDAGDFPELDNQYMPKVVKRLRGVTC